MAENRFSKLLRLQTSNMPRVPTRTSTPLSTGGEEKAFKPVPQAGVFGQEDLDYLQRCQQAVYAAQKVDRSSNRVRETLSNTTRYHQVPGTNTIYGGRIE
jgi:hypothetical protein